VDAGGGAACAALALDADSPRELEVADHKKTGSASADSARAAGSALNSTWNCPYGIRALAVVGQGRRLRPDAEPPQEEQQRRAEEEAGRVHSQGHEQGRPQGELSAPAVEKRQEQRFEQKGPGLDGRQRRQGRPREGG